MKIYRKIQGILRNCFIACKQLTISKCNKTSLIQQQIDDVQINRPNMTTKSSSYFFSLYKIVLAHYKLKYTVRPYGFKE